MATQVVYVGDGSTVTYSIPFDYKSSTTDLNATVDGEATEFSLDNPSTLRFAAAPDTGARIKIFRSTPFEDREVEFADTAVLGASDLNVDSDQVFRKVQEIADDAAAITARAVRTPEGESIAALPSASTRADSLASYDTDGNPSALSVAAARTLFKGEPGAAGNVAADLTQLKAAAIANVTMIYDGATFNWTPGDFTGDDDDINIIESDNEPLSGGAWVRQGAQSVTFQQAATGSQIIDLNHKVAEQISLLDVLTPAERADVMSGTNSIDITAKFKALLEWVEANRPGAEIDATMVRGTWHWSVNPFADLYRCRAKLRLGSVVITKDVNTNVTGGGPIKLPSNLSIEAQRVTIRASAKITTLSENTAPAIGVVQSHVWQTYVTGTAGASTLTAQFAGGIQPGARLLILAHDEDSYIEHTLDGALGTGTGAIAFNETASTTLGTSNLVYLLIGSEIVEVSASGGSFTMTGRGMFGTAAEAHADNAVVKALVGGIYNVVSKDGTTITIAETLARSFTNSVGFFGMVDTSLTNIDIDGTYDRTSGWAQFAALALPIAKRFTVTGARLSRGSHGGVIAFGSTGCSFDFDLISGCGKPADNLGSSIWVFGRNDNIRMNIRRIEDGYIGWAIDNKSYGISYFAADGPNRACWLTIGLITSHDVEGELSGSTNCSVQTGVAETARAVIVYDGQPQTTEPVPTGGMRSSPMRG
ncbi:MULTISPECIES: phage tail fiber protein [unclassified Sphingomonas]|uniref:phage tail fiber domain-containing protein n=1 Tax=unclassified Sphingomonas TaxID=196159 RepID=UPI002151021A|nr:MULTISPECIES: phage tail fiber protein [unclassified Sphingomonas]MCR5870672.1 hypothetical protein [Sphingomonas sp. J344]UUY00992.1 hypothetical protein LRS08_08030 [Sphingomonas sp. J315]